MKVRWLGVAALAVVLVWLLSPTAQPVSQFLIGADIPLDTRAILLRSCADCHSDGTRYPWYSHLPLLSRMIAEDVARGREQLNFSRWNEYSRLRKQRALTGIANQVKDRAMPLPNYLWLHPSARLSDAEIETVFRWADKERLRLILSADIK